MEDNIVIETNYDLIRVDIYDIFRLFFPNGIDGNIKIVHNLTKDENGLHNSCTLQTKEKSSNAETVNKLKKFESLLEERKYYKRFAKLCVYQAFSKLLNKNLPWGSLTGIRPTSLAYDLMKEGVESHLIKDTLMRNFLVSEEKARLVEIIIKNQTCLIRNDNLIDLYINIPICPSRCSYCSFISSEKDKVRDKIPTYIDCLIKEIRETKKLIYDKALVVRTIYVGGGTPTCIDDEDMERLLKELSYSVNEFTVESGRPETITEEKLKLFKKYGVTRICINPQTFVQKTLKLIGRKHTTKDVLEAYKLALKYGFVVNMDLIAGLPGESFSNFKKSLDTALELYPENITVHTLSVKNGSNMALENNEQDCSEIEKMVRYANEKLTNNGYKPYYLYRQKNQLKGLENVGYFRDNNLCIFNVDSMEETCSVLACGAGAITKRIFNIENRIERSPNVKFIEDYIQRIDEMIQRKRELFK